MTHCWIQKKIESNDIKIDELLYIQHNQLSSRVEELKRGRVNSQVGQLIQ